MNTKIIYEKQDFRNLSWTELPSTGWIGGSFLKAVDFQEKPFRYYKLSFYDSIKGIIGHECVNELIVDRLLNILGISHIHYQLINARVKVENKEQDTWLCISEDFRKKEESKIALDVFYELEKTKEETPFSFCIRNGWEDQIYEMLLVDFLILNRDRHGANLEVMKNNRIRELYLAPLFDHGLSLLFSCHDESEIRNYNVLEDKPVQCFLGSCSAAGNLELIPSGKLPKVNPLQKKHKAELLMGLEQIMPSCFLEKIWEMLWKRWEAYEDFCNQRRK